MLSTNWKDWPITCSLLLVYNNIEVMAPDRTKDVFKFHCPSFFFTTDIFSHLIHILCCVWFYFLLSFLSFTHICPYIHTAAVFLFQSAYVRQGLVFTHSSGVNLIKAWRDLTVVNLFWPWEIGCICFTKELRVRVIGEGFYRLPVMYNQ